MGKHYRYKNEFNKTDSGIISRGIISESDAEFYSLTKAGSLDLLLSNAGLSD